MDNSVYSAAATCAQTRGSPGTLAGASLQVMGWLLSDNSYSGVTVYSLVALLPPAAWMVQCRVAPFAKAFSNPA